MKSIDNLTRLNASSQAPNDGQMGEKWPKRKKTILQINVTANWGSTGKIAEQIGLKAMDAGWESYIAYGRMMKPSKSHLIEIGSKLGVYVHYTLGHFFDMEGLSSRRATKKLISKIGRIKPAIIHLHNIHDHYLNYPLLFEYLSTCEIPIVWTQHDQWSTTGGCFYTPDSCEKWKIGCYDCPLKGRWSPDNSKRNYALKKRYFSKPSDVTIVSVSGWMRLEVEQSFLGSYNSLVINNGVDTAVFKPKECHSDKYSFDNKRVLLGVAHPWSERKGLKDYIALSRMLPADCIIVLVGMSEIQRKGLPKNIKGLGVTRSVEELVALYNRADIVLNLSYAETFGLTTVEGFACGTPGIVYNRTASPELITPETGVVVEAGNIEGVAQAILEILKKGKSYYSEACRKRAEMCYDKNKCFEKYVALYEQLYKKNNETSINT